MDDRKDGVPERPLADASWGRKTAVLAGCVQLLMDLGRRARVAPEGGTGEAEANPMDSPDRVVRATGD